MKRALKIFGLLVAGYLLLIQSGLLSAIALFWLTGLVPGTSYALPPLASSLLLVVISLLALAISRPGLLKTVLAYRLRATKPVHRLPKRRYARINAN